MEHDDQLKPIIEPLEIMIGSDDQTVREKAVLSMRKVGRLLEDSSIRDIYIPLLKRQRKGDMFPMRISVCFLYADIYDRVDAEM